MALGGEPLGTASLGGGAERNVLLIRRRYGSGTPSNLEFGELSFSDADEAVDVGKSDGTTVRLPGLGYVDAAVAARQPLDSDLTALASVSAAGLLARTGAGAAAARTITGTTNQVTVTNGDGASGNPTLALPQDIHTSGAPQFAAMGLGRTASTSGVAFPLAQSASSDANTLDDYEEGSWTPVLRYGGVVPTGITYAVQVGRYTKVGRVVTAEFYVSLSNKGSTATGAVAIYGLPFTADSTAGLYAGGGGWWYGLTSGNGWGFNWYVSPNTTVATLAGNGATGSVALTDAMLTNTSQFVATVTYLADT